MIRGIYAAASGLAALLRRQEALSHNLANLSTPGFKQEVTLMQDAPGRDLLRAARGEGQGIGVLPPGVNGNDIVVDYSQGPLENTGRNLDLAILGEGFFQVQTPDGVRLTRDGTFHRDSAGNLVTGDGYFVLGANGPIQLGEGVPTVVEDGSIYLPGATQPAGRISLVGVANPAALQREDHNLLNPGGANPQPVTAGSGMIKQGMIEQANVDISGNSISMMLALRSYEAVQRTIKAQDETLQRLMDVGRVG